MPLIHRNKYPRQANALEVRFGLSYLGYFVPSRKTEIRFGRWRKRQIHLGRLRMEKTEDLERSLHTTDIIFRGNMAMALNIRVPSGSHLRHQFDLFCNSRLRPSPLFPLHLSKDDLPPCSYSLQIYIGKLSGIDLSPAQIREATLDWLPKGQYWYSDRLAILIVLTSGDHYTTTSLATFAKSLPSQKEITSESSHEKHKTNYPTIENRPLGSGLSGIGCYSILHMPDHCRLAWSTAYSWSLNNISDLGNIYCQPWGDNARYVCSSLHDLMNVSIITQGILIITGVFILRALWGPGCLSQIARSLLVIAGLAMAIAGFAPADVNGNVHVVLGAFPLTFLGNIGLILGGPALKTSMARKIQLLGPVIGAVGLIATWLFFSGNYLGLGMGGMERFAVLNVPTWTFNNGLLFVGQRRNQ